MKKLTFVLISALIASTYAAYDFYQKYQMEIIAGAATAAALVALKKAYDADIQRNAAQKNQAQRDSKKAVAKCKAKARAGKLIAAVPLFGAGYAVASETADFQDWKAANPDGTMTEYTQEVESLYREMWEESKNNGWIKDASDISGKVKGWFE
jgi:hypothetical protein